MADLEVEIPTDDDWPAICAADERGFGFAYDPADIEEMRPTFDLSRFRVIRDHGAIVGVAASVGLEVTLPGGGTVPMGGVTWVSVAATHRRRGHLRRMMDACHDDIDARSEPIASLTASEGGIYERFGYGIATTFRNVSIEPRAARWAGSDASATGPVRYATRDETLAVVEPRWERARRDVPGEVGRTRAWHEMLLATGSRPQGGKTPVHHLVHDDGYAAYRIEADWGAGIPRHEVTLNELVAATPAAHDALWRTLVEMDLVERIVMRRFPVDDPLPYQLSNGRAVHTTAWRDGVWVNVRDVRAAFGARRYATDDSLVVEVVDERGAARRWRIDGAPDGASVAPVRTRPDLTLSRAALGALLYGGTRPSALARGGRIDARDDRALARADLFFPWRRQPNCQTPY
jgi:predicted acetyltransferase